MMGSVSMPPTVTIDHVHALLTILSNPDTLKEHLHHLKDAVDQSNSKLVEIREREEALAEREKAVEERERLATEEDKRLADLRSRINSDHDAIERRVGLLKQAGIDIRMG